MRKTRATEKRDLLTTSNRIHDINGRETCLDHIFGVCTRIWVDGIACVRKRRSASESKRERTNLEYQSFLLPTQEDRYQWAFQNHRKYDQAYLLTQQDEECLQWTRCRANTKCKQTNLWREEQTTQGMRTQHTTVLVINAWCSLKDLHKKIMISVKRDKFATCPLRVFSHTQTS